MRLNALLTSLLMVLPAALSAQGYFEFTGNAASAMLKARSRQEPPPPSPPENNTPAPDDVSAYTWWNCVPFGGTEPGLDVCVCRKEGCREDTLKCQGILVTRGECDQNCDCSALPFPPAEQQPPAPLTENPPAAPPVEDTLPPAPEEPPTEPPVEEAPAAPQAEEQPPPEIPPPVEPPPPAEPAAPEAPPPAPTTLETRARETPEETQAPGPTSEPPAETETPELTSSQEGEPQETNEPEGDHEDIDENVAWDCSESEGHGEGQCACNPPHDCWFQGTQCYGMVVDKGQANCGEDCRGCTPLAAGFSRM